MTAQEKRNSLQAVENFIRDLDIPYNPDQSYKNILVDITRDREKIGYSDSIEEVKIGVGYALIYYHFNGELKGDNKVNTNKIKCEYDKNEKILRVYLDDKKEYAFKGEQ